MQGTTSSKRRLDPSKTARSKAGSKSHLSQTQLKYCKPLPDELIIKKYYTPVIKQEQKFSAFLITRFLVGYRSKDELGITELLSFNGGGEFMRSLNGKADSLLKSAIIKKMQSDSILSPFPHFFCQVHFIIEQNRRRKKNLVSKQNSFKKDDMKSTAVNSNKEIQKVLEIDFTNDHQEQKLNDTQELGKLSKCLKKILGKQESGKAYKMFIAKMEKKGGGQTKAEGMLKFILNLERDFSSIQQEQELDFSKESAYGLSDLKKKSDRNNSKLEVKLKQKEKDKRLSTNFPFARFQFTKKPAKDNDKNSNCHSTSKNSRKSSSMRSRKQVVVGTPDHHGVKSKSKSSAKKTTNKVLVQKKSKLTDTERLYFDEAPQKNQQKIESKLLIKESLRKVECQNIKSKKKLVRR